MPIPGPRHDLRPGPASAAAARLTVLALLASLQYWLLTSSMEAWAAGDKTVPLWGFLASLICFALGAGLLISGEWTSRQRETRR